MKPSQRIEEWRVFFQKNRPSETALENTLSAIITYLDEQYEQQKPCEHEYEPFKEYAQTCKKCGIISSL